LADRNLGLINRLKGKEQLIADARAKGQSTDQALSSTDDAVAQNLLADMSTDEMDAKAELRLLRDFENSIEAGFQMATFQGPLCAEPVVGMAWVVENVSFNKDAEDGESESPHFIRWTGAYDRSRKEFSGSRSLDLFRPRFMSSGNVGLVTTYQTCNVHL
jgi:translation elongation factor EF-G